MNLLKQEPVPDVRAKERNKMKKNKDSVKLILTIRGNSIFDTANMVNKHYDYVYKTYPGASVSKIAEIISSLSAHDDV